MNRLNQDSTNSKSDGASAENVKNSDDLFKFMIPDLQLQKPWWRVAKTFFNSHRFTEHQIDSYNLFMREKLPNIITGSEFEYQKEKNGPTNIVTFDNVYIKKPEFTEPNGVTQKLYPDACRERDLSYTCSVYTDVTRYTVDADSKIIATKTFPEVFIGAMPCMILSDYCHLSQKDSHGLIKKKECVLDPGGYFIIKGNEKVLMSQDRMGHNEIFIFKAKDKETIKLPVPGSDKNRSIPCAWYAEVRSYSDHQEPNITTTYLKLSRAQLDKGEDARLYVEIPNLKSPVPWPILFMALGVCQQEEMIGYITDPTDVEMISLLEPSLDCPQIKTQEQALKYLSTFVLGAQKDLREAQLKKILRDKLFQNITQTHMKRFYLGHMTYQLLATSLGRRGEDDRDHYATKRVEVAGNLINNLFKSIWKRVLREAKNQLEKKRTNDLAQILYAKFSNYITPPFSNGNWTATKLANKASKVGISQLLNRHNYVSTLSNLRRVITPSDKNSKIIKPRHLHNSQWMYMCPAETPEGQATGLIKNLGMLTTVSLGSDDEQIIHWLLLRPQLATVISEMTDLNPSDIQTKTKVFVNGAWVAVTSDPDALLQELRSLRRQGKIAFEVSISLIKGGVRIYTDDGRVLVPFLVVENGKLKELPIEDFTWLDLVDQGIVEYLDPAELETLYHAQYPWAIESDHTHSVIHPSFMFGVAASTAPFANHNQAPRVIYQCLWEEEPVLMSNGTRKKIKDVRVGDSVITFNPTTFRTEETRVIHALTSETEKKIVEITTISGRSIVVTEDHKMMTARGWVEAKDLQVSDRVAILLEPMHMDSSCEEWTIITSENFKTCLKEYSVKSSLIELHCKQLEALQLLPLKTSHPHLHILARMYGFLQTGGSINVSNVPTLTANFCSINSAEEFEQDVSTLRFEKTSINDNFEIQHCDALVSLFIALGCKPNSQKLNNIPKWLTDTSRLVCREFLAGFQSGSNAKSIDNSLSIHCKGVEYLKCIRDALLSFNIDCELVTGKCAILIQQNYDNIIRYFNTIMYRYCDRKTVKYGKFVELLRTARTVNHDYLPNWSHLEHCAQTIFVPIADVKPKENVRIADITTESNNHCFIGGDNFCVHNSAMCKQALGVFAGNFLHRLDTSAHILCYPQKPLVNTKTMNLLNTDEVPSGQNLIIAIMTAGYNQEDSVVINKRAIDNGALRSICYTTYSESFYRKGTTHIEIKKPEKMQVQEARIHGYTKLDSDGISKENTPLAKRDIVIGKVNTISTQQIVKDASIVIKSNGMAENSVVEVNENLQRTFVVSDGSAIVDRSIVTLNNDSFKTVKVRTRQMRIPIIGDKVASRSAQKGIAGMMLDPENMPFSKKTGMSPDIMMNPHAIPSRMTIAQILEAILGKACCLRGTFGDCTPFEEGFSEEAIENELEKYGFERHGNEVMIDGTTGEEMPCTLFMNPTFYQRLKHMVHDKIHCLTPDHDVLTSNGWRAIDKITTDDYVATLQNGELIYAKPINIWRYQHNGDMYHVQNEHIDLLTTLNHKMLVNLEPNNPMSIYSLTEASKIIGKHVLYQNLDGSISVNENTVQDKIIQYNGSVHCLEVPGNTFYVRRNGKPVWTGNSREQNGPRETLTRQPVEGRKRGGGFRMGEMETWCGISHGASMFLIDRLVNNSDGYEQYVCDYCGNTAIATLKTRRFECKNCQQNTNISKIRIPYAFKLLQQELQATVMGVWFNVDTTQTLTSNQ